MNKLKIIILLIISFNYAFAQSDFEYSDKLLANSFKVYKDADFEMSYHIFSFLKERFITHIKDTTSFYNPHDSLSKYISIKKTADSLVKTYSWHEKYSHNRFTND